MDKDMMGRIAKGYIMVTGMATPILLLGMLGYFIDVLFVVGPLCLIIGLILGTIVGSSVLYFSMRK